MAEENANGAETYTEKDLEQFRLKFRREALKACEEAERRGYKEGSASKQNELKSAQDDARRWQRIAEAVGVDADTLPSEPKPMSLVKYVMEHVYREVRTQFTEYNNSQAGKDGVIATEEAVNILKNVLLSTTETLAAKMPAVMVTGKRPPRSASLGDLASSASAAAADASASAGPTGSSLMKWRPSNVIYPFLYPLRLLIKADIESSRIVGGSGAFSSGHTSYCIRHSLRANERGASGSKRVTAGILATLSDDGMEEHRYKEFEHLGSALRKNFPDAVFPPIPPKEAAGTNSSAVQAATLSVLDRDTKDKSLGINEPRRRQLVMWIKFICMHHHLQLSPDFLTFLCKPEAARRLLRALKDADESLGAGDSAGRKRVQSTYTNSVFLSEMLSSTGNGDNFVYEGVGPVVGDAPAHKSTSSFVGSHIKSSGIYNSTTTAVGKSSSPPAVAADKSVVQGYTDIARNVAQRQLHTAIRDFDQLEPHMAAAIECSKYWYYALEAQADAWQAFVETLPGMIAVENCNYCNSGAASAFRIRGAQDGVAPDTVCMREAQLWEVLHVTLRDSILPSMESDYTVINTKFYEPHFYCGSLCLAQARASISNTKSLSPGSDEHVEASLKTAQEWSIFRRIRHALLMEYEEDAVVALMFEKQKQLTAWSMAFSDMSSGGPMSIPVNDACGGASSSKKKDKTDGGFMGLTLPSTDSLKGAVEDEIRSLDEHVSRLRREYEDCRRRSLHGGDEWARSGHSGSQGQSEPMSTSGGGRQRTRTAGSIAVPAPGVEEDSAGIVNGASVVLDEGLAGGLANDYFAEPEPEARASLSENFVHVDPGIADADPPSTPKTKPPGLKKELKSMFKKVFSNSKPSSSAAGTSDPDAYSSSSAAPDSSSDAYGTPAVDASLYDAEPVAAGGAHASSLPSAHSHSSHVPARRPVRPVATGRLHANANQGNLATAVPADLFSGARSSAPVTGSNAGAPSVQVPTPSATVIKQSQRVNVTAAAAPVASTPAKRAAGKVGGGYQWGGDSSAAGAGGHAGAATARGSASVNTAVKPTATAHSAPAATKPPAPPAAAEPLPSGWEEVKQATGPPYYYHKITRVSRWDRPTASEADVGNEERAHPAPVDPVASKRKEDKGRAADAEASLADELRDAIKSALQTWKFPHGTSHVRGASGSAMASFPDLLQSLPSLLPALLMDSTVSFSLDEDSSGLGVKKLYMKAVRIIHPDKIPADTDVYTKMLAQEAFIVLSQQFDQFRKTL